MQIYATMLYALGCVAAMAAHADPVNDAGAAVQPSKASASQLSASQCAAPFAIAPMSAYATGTTFVLTKRGLIAIAEPEPVRSAEPEYVNTGN